MNVNQHLHSNSLSAHRPQYGTLSQLRIRCLRCYESVLRRLAHIRAGVEETFNRRMAGYEQVLKAAMLEAEALAWQTPYPHLFFPTLAEEKAVEAQRWAAHQRAVQARGQVEAAAV